MPRASKPAASKPPASRLRTTKKKANGGEPLSVSPDEIARRAYDLFLRDGAVPGRDVEHWLLAEQELRNERQAQGD